MGDAWNPDRIIVLTSSSATIERHIRLRQPRRTRTSSEMVRRFQLIDAEFRRLAAVRPEGRRHRS